MTTTVKELIEYLKTIPLDTELRVVVTYDCQGGYATCTKLVPLDLDPTTGNVEYIDTNGNRFIEKHSELWDRRFLDFGET